MKRTPSILTAVSAVLGLILLWCLTGDVWGPFADVLKYAQRLIGGLAGAGLVAFLASARFRDDVRAFFRKLNETEIPRRPLLFSLFAALAIMGIYKHNSLQSHMHDFGIFLNVSWNAAHGNGFYDPIINVNSFLGDHWSPVLGAFAPFLWVWPDPRIFLLAQAAAGTLAAWGLFRIAEHAGLKKEWAFFVAAAFLLHPFLHRIHRFDFHPEALSMPLLVWGTYFVLKERTGLGLFLFFLTWFTKEDLPIVTFGAGLAFFLLKRRKLGAVMMASSVVYFLIVVGVLMPHFLGSDVHTHFIRYRNLGEDTAGILRTILFRPDKVVVDVFGDHHVWETALHLLLPFFALPLLSGPFALTALAAWSPHMLSGYINGQRTLSGPYSTGVLSFLGIALAFGLAKLLTGGRWKKIGQRVDAWGPAPFLFILLINWGFGVPRYTKPVTRERIQAFHRIIKQIPAGTAVCAQGALGNHVAMRRVLTQFPDWYNTDYVLLEPSGNTWMVYPFDDYEGELAKVKSSPFYELAAEDGGFLLFKKKAG